MAKHTFTVLIEKDEDGIFIASVPALRGCYTQAKTMDELLVRIQEVIELCLEADKDELCFNQFVGVQQVEIQV
jgi:predicted RNase H-like HicB family nuclease